MHEARLQFSNATASASKNPIYSRSTTMNFVMNFLDYMDSWLEQALFEKREEIFAKVRKTPPPVENNMNANSDDQARTTDVSIAPDGTLLSWIHTLKEPIRGYAHPSAIKLTAIYKRLIFQVIESVSRQSNWQKVLTVVGLGNVMHVLDDWFEYVFMMYPVLLKDEHYCQPVKELRRALRGKVKDNLLDAITLVVECDSAYKYRFQDILPLLDQAKLTGYFSTTKELKRLIDILKERDSAQESQPVKYEKLKKVIGIVLLLPKARKTIEDILKEVNLEEIKLSKEDICFTNTYTVYKIGGRSWEERKQENINNGNKL